jgi:hypothetical protein
MARHLLPLTPSRRAEAHAWVDRAIQLGRENERAWVMELREAKRSDDQNAALWSLLGQIAKQRPVHNGVRMTPELYKAVFMQAWGAEVVFLPTLDGDGMFPAGHRSSQLTKGEFSELLEVMLAWCAREGIVLKHFDAAEQVAA